jgi:hypothetical protein
MRDFWIEVDIDGRRTKLRGGPRSKGGEMSLTIYAKNTHNESEEILHVKCSTINGIRVAKVFGVDKTITSEIRAASNLIKLRKLDA